MTTADEYNTWYDDWQAKREALPDPLYVANARTAVITWAAENDDTSKCKTRTTTIVNSACSIEWTRPNRAVTPPSKGEILWVHGAVQQGSAASYRPIAAQLASRTPAAVAMLEYRRPPEYRFPAPLYDVLNTLLWMESNGHPMSDLVLGADSFGAMPALAAVIARRNAGMPLPRGIYLLCPDVDYSNRKFLQQRPLTSSDPVTCLNDEALNQYFSDPLFPCTTPAAAPLLDDLTGLPPILHHDSQAKILASGKKLKDKMAALGSAVAYTYEEWTDVPHDFPLYYGKPLTPFFPTNGNDALTKAAAWIGARLS